MSETNSKTKDKIKYIYDDNGNLIKKKIKGKSVVYQYDIENRLRSVSQGGQLLMAATYDGMDNKVFQMSRKLIERDVPKEDDDGEDDEDSEIGGTFFDPDMFMYGFMQGGMKMGASTSPTLVAGIGDKLCEIWDGIRTYFTGKIEYVDPEELADIVVPGTERGIFITYDITNYLNDTVFNEYTQVMYQYDENEREKASYVYGAYDERLSADKTRRAVSYVADKPGSYTYMYDGHGSVTQELRSGKEVNSYYYDPYGAVERGTEENDIIFGYNGEEYTEATQLQYLRQRHYAPEIGSFLTQDMYRGDLYEPNSQNRYTYAGNDPVNYNDPGGDKRRSVADKTSYGGSNRRGANKAETIAAANANLNKALSTVSGAAKNLYNTLTSNAAAAAHNSPRSSTSKSSTTAYTRQQMAKQAVESFKNSNNLFDMAEFLQRGFECDGGKVSNSGPRGTREPAGPRREYKVPIEDRPGVWAVGVEVGGSIGPIYFEGGIQYVTDVQGNDDVLWNIDGGISIEKLINQLKDKKKILSGELKGTYTFVNAPDLDVYTDSTAQEFGISGRRYGASGVQLNHWNKDIKEYEDYYGYSISIGALNPGVSWGAGDNGSILDILNQLKEGR